MRLWEDADRRLCTDEQLLRYAAHFGSLGAAVEHGDIQLLAESPSDAPRRTKDHRPRLADYIAYFDALESQHDEGGLAPSAGSSPQNNG